MSNLTAIINPHEDIESDEYSYTQSISKSLEESLAVKSKERTQPYVNETEARRLTNQEFERRRVYSKSSQCIHYSSRTSNLKGEEYRME